MTTELAIATGTREALAKGSYYLYDPDQLLLITDPAHPLYDPRALTKPDAGLVDSMLNYGFKTSSSIEIESTKDGMVVVDGRRRVLAARAVKRKQIDAGEDVTIRVRCLVSKDKAFVGMILGNAHRLEETVLQKAAKAKRALDMGNSVKEVAALFGVTAQTISNWTAAMALPDAIRKSLDEDKITLTLALELAKKPEEEQAAALKSAEVAPLKGATGKARVRKAPQEDVAKALGKAQIRKFHTMLKEQGKPDSNVELAIAMCEFILGDGTYRKLHTFPPLGEIAKEMIDG